MSIEGIANYEHGSYEYTRPAWERLERMDYCDQSVSYRSSFLSRLKKLFTRKH